MKPALSVTLAAALAVGPALPALADVSYSPTIGYYKFDVPAGASLWVCGFVKAKTHQGIIDGIASGAQSVVTENDRAFTPGELDNHYLEILTPGTFEGLIVDIVSNDANTITVDADLSSLSGSESFAVREHVTLGDLLPGGGGLAAFNDSLTLFYPDGSRSVFSPADFGGTPFWFNTATIANADDERIYAGQGFIINATSSKEILIGQNGVNQVKETKTFVSLYPPPAINVVGLVNPLVSTDPLAPSTVALGDVGLLEALTPFQDSVTIRENDGFLTVAETFSLADFGSGRFFFSSPDFPNANSYPIDVGAALVITVSGDRAWQQFVTHPISN